MSLALLGAKIPRSQGVGSTCVYSLGHVSLEKYIEDDDVVQAVAGNHITFLLTEQGKVYVCGKNDKGQCGIAKSVFTFTVPNHLTFYLRVTYYRSW